MAEFITIARPYARAAFETATADNTVAAWMKTLKALVALVANEQINRLIRNPQVTNEQLESIFLVALASEKLDDKRSNFIRLLITSQRLLLAEDIVALFKAYQDDAEQSIDAEAVSAYPLSDEQIQMIQQALARSTGKTVTLRTDTDAALLGGAIVRAGDSVIDGSLRTRLENLSATLAH